MKPRPRIRKTVKWGGLALTVVLVGVWVGTGSKAVLWVGRSGATVGLGHGAFSVGRLFGGPVNLPAGWMTFEGDFRLAWLPQWSETRGGWGFALPLWILVTVLVIATATAWRLDILARRRGGLNLCQRCGYDRSGLAGGAGAVCPECGAGAPGGAARQ